MLLTTLLLALLSCFSAYANPAGDADYDGRLTISDAEYIFQKTLNNSAHMPVESVGDNFMDYVDADMDGKLTSADVAHVLQKILDSTYVMPAEKNLPSTEITTETSTEETTQPTTAETTQTSTETTTEPVTETTTKPVTEPPTEPSTSGSSENILVAYFSCTGNTKTIAQYAAEITGGDIYEITPQIPYTPEDLAYYTDCRADREQNDPDARPEISGSVENMDQYDTVFIGYPIWHSQAPRIISTFLESYDFTGKKIIPFCTSGSSPIGSSAENLHPLASKAAWEEGMRFSGSSPKDDVQKWIDAIDVSAGRKVGKFDFSKHTVLLNSGYEMPVMGLGTYSLTDEECYNSVTALLNSGGRLIDTAYMYGNEAAVGRAIRDSQVPREEIFVITKIYPGEQFANPEKAIQDALDKLNIGYIDMMLLHHPGTGDVEAYKAMEKAAEEGKIHSLGLSNFYVEELTEFLPQVNITPALVQNEIHPFYQENDVIPFIQEKGIVVQGWYPFGGRGHTSELLNNETITQIASAHNVSSAQVILRWNLQKGVVVIPGSSNPDHIKENLDLFGFELTDAEMAAINALDRNEKHDWY